MGVAWRGVTGAPVPTGAASAALRGGRPSAAAPGPPPGGAVRARRSVRGFAAAGGCGVAVSRETVICGARTLLKKKKKKSVFERRSPLGPGGRAGRWHKAVGSGSAERRGSRYPGAAGRHASGCPQGRGEGRNGGGGERGGGGTDGTSAPSGGPRNVLEGGAGGGCCPGFPALPARGTWLPVCRRPGGAGGRAESCPSSGTALQHVL